MTKDELIKEIHLYINNLKEQNKQLNILGSLGRKTNKLSKYIFKYTAFLDNFKKVKNTERIYCLINNIYYRPKCIECQEKYVQFIDFTYGYREFCSNKCVNKSNIVKQRQYVNYKKVTGYDNPSQNPEVKIKKKRTCLLNYGCENPQQNTGIRRKTKKTNVMKYGYENPQQNKSIREETSKTSIRRYGYIVINNSPEYQKETIKKNLNLYGCEYFVQSTVFKEKAKQTYFKRTGYDHMTHNPVAFEKQQRSLFKYKDYKFPSGNIVRVQGYEPFAIDILLETYKENQILTNLSDMPEIWYYTEDNKKHRYYCDIFIPHENKLIEVKSLWTYKKDERINNLKQNACTKCNYNHEIWIIDRTGTLIEIKKG